MIHGIMLFFSVGVGFYRAIYPIYVFEVKFAMGV